jgi:hypothetical protein
MSASPPFADLPPSLHAERQGALALRLLARPAKRGGASVRLPRLIGTARMMDMMLTGRTCDAEEGQAMRGPKTLHGGRRPA